MVDEIRNVGRPGIASMAIAAVDTALWDLKARLLDLPLVDLLGRDPPRGPGVRQRRIHVATPTSSSPSNSAAGCTTPGFPR